MCCAPIVYMFVYILIGAHIVPLTMAISERNAFILLHVTYGCSIGYCEHRSYTRLKLQFKVRLCDREIGKEMANMKCLVHDCELPWWVN